MTTLDTLRLWEEVGDFLPLFPDKDGNPTHMLTEAISPVWTISQLIRLLGREPNPYFWGETTDDKWKVILSNSQAGCLALLWLINRMGPQPEYLTKI